MTVVIWTCNRCEGTACEVASDDGDVPRHCPMDRNALWKRGWDE